MSSIKTQACNLVPSIAAESVPVPVRRVNAMAVLLAACVVLCQTQPVLAYATPEWLFKIEMPVKDQSAGERTRVAQIGLLTVLSRVTGLTSVPRVAEIGAALNNTPALYNEFAFYNRQGAEGRSELMLEINYQPAQILSLTRAAQLPLWWTQRPVVMVWLAIDENGRRDIISADSAHPLREALVEAARTRGLELVFPVMDLTDQLAVSAADVWGRVAGSLNDAAKRYDADIVWTGRLRTSLAALRGLDVQGDWSFWLYGRTYTDRIQGTQYPVVAEQSVGQLVSGLVEQFSVPARQPVRRLLRMSGLDAPASYMAMMQHLESLDFLSDVQVVSVQGETLTLTVATSADAQQLSRLLTTSAQLTRDDFYRGIDPQFIWRSQTVAKFAGRQTESH